MAPKPMPVRISKPGFKNVFEYWNFRDGSIFLPARLASREVAIVSNPFQPAFSVWVTSQFASIHQIASAWTCEIWFCQSYGSYSLVTVFYTWGDRLKGGGPDRESS